MKSLGELTRTRPVDRFGRSSAVVMLLLALWAWSGDAFALGDLGSERAQSNLARFLGELRPYPLQGAPWDGAAFLRWLVDTTRGITLGEVTIYPAGGFHNTPTRDPDFNLWLGDQWTLPKSK